MATKAPSTAPSTNPLADSLTKVTGIDPLSTTAGTASPISYDPDLAFRAPEGDIISITGDPGTGASQAETWSHELSLEQLQQDQLEFEYAMQQDLLSQALAEEELKLATDRQAQEMAIMAYDFQKQQEADKQAEWDIAAAKNNAMFATLQPRYPEPTQVTEPWQGTASHVIAPSGWVSTGLGGNYSYAPPPAQSYQKPAGGWYPSGVTGASWTK